MLPSISTFKPLFILSFSLSLLLSGAYAHSQALDPVWHRLMLDSQTQQDATPIERLGSKVKITDLTHSLYGQEVTLVSLISPRGKNKVIIELGNGRRRSIDRSAINITPNPTLLPQELIPISVRTLLPLARYIRAMLDKRQEVPNENHTTNLSLSEGNKQSTIKGSSGNLENTTQTDAAANYRSICNVDPAITPRKKLRRITMGSEVALAKISALQQSKLAYIYLRQSSMGQVRNNQESTALQYQLAERAVMLGWPREQIKVIDEDLGKSGKSIQSRFGFQNLMAEIGLGKVGLVLSLDASRLARNNSNWYRLLELCSIFSVLIADAERVYDLNTYHDRLLLGLSGLMSEAELHQIKTRLQNGARNKAERGELKFSLPVGYVRLRSDEVILNPDEEIQQRIKLVFQKFKELSTANAVVRYLQKSELYLPARPLNGPTPHAVVWRMATNTRVLQILKNPAYAGAYVYGGTCQ